MENVIYIFISLSNCEILLWPTGKYPLLGTSILKEKYKPLHLCSHSQFKSNCPVLYKNYMITEKNMRKNLRKIPFRDHQNYINYSNIMAST